MRSRRLTREQLLAVERIAWVGGSWRAAWWRCHCRAALLMLPIKYREWHEAKR